MLRLAFDFIITWRETRTRPNAYTKIAIIVQHPLIFILLQVIIISGAIVVLCLFSKLVKNITPTAYSILSGGR